MSDKTLSQRLRELEGNLSEAGMNIDGPSMSLLAECIAQAEAQDRECEAMCGDHGGIEGCSCSLCSTPLGPIELTAFCNGCGALVKWPLADGTDHRVAVKEAKPSQAIGEQTPVDEAELIRQMKSAPVVFVPAMSSDARDLAVEALDRAKSILDAADAVFAEGLVVKVDGSFHNNVRGAAIEADKALSALRP